VSGARARPLGRPIRSPSPAGRGRSGSAGPSCRGVTSALGLAVGPSVGSGTAGSTVYPAARVDRFVGPARSDGTGRRAGRGPSFARPVASREPGRTASGAPSSAPLPASYVRPGKLRCRTAIRLEASGPRKGRDDSERDVGRRAAPRSGKQARLAAAPARPAARRRTFASCPGRLDRVLRPRLGRAAERLTGAGSVGRSKAPAASRTRGRGFGTTRSEARPRAGEGDRANEGPTGARTRAPRPWCGRQDPRPVLRANRRGRARPSRPAIPAANGRARRARRLPPQDGAPGSGSCCVMQWIPPPPHTRSLASIWTTSRSGKAARTARNAARSAGS